MGEITKKNKKQKLKKNHSEMSFLDHLEELRIVLIKSIVAILTSSVAVGLFVFKLNNCLMYPFRTGVARYLESHPGQVVGGLRVSSFFSPFIVFLYMTIFGGFFIALPFVLYFIAQFLMPALTKRERKIMFPAIIALVVLFLLGASFAFFGILPVFINFSLNLANLFHYADMFDAESYYYNVIFLTVGMGVSFELPLLVVILIYLEIISAATLRKYRRHIFVVILIFSGLITPPDIISMLMLAFPLYAMFELAIIVGEKLLKRKRIAEERDEDKYNKHSSREKTEEDSRYTERHFKRKDEDPSPESDPYADYENQARLSYEEGMRNLEGNGGPQNSDSETMAAQTPEESPVPPEETEQNSDGASAEKN